MKYNLGCWLQQVVKLTSNSSKRTLTGRLLVGTAEAIPSAELVDTTGAGDAFIGAVMYCKLDLLSLILSFLVFWRVISKALYFYSLLFSPVRDWIYYSTNASGGIKKGNINAPDLWLWVSMVFQCMQHCWLDWCPRRCFHLELLW